MAWFKCAVRRPLPESGDQPAIRPTQVIFHTAVDAPGATNLHGYFSRADITLESHFWSPLSRPLEQFMDTEERADANRNANLRPDGTGAISVETEDEGNPEGLPWNAKQMDDLVNIGVEAHLTHGIPIRLCRFPTDPGFGWHAMWGAPSAWTPSAGKTCPGSKRIAQIPEILRRIQERVDALAAPPPSEEDDMPASLWRHDGEAAVWCVAHDFQSRWHVPNPTVLGVLVFLGSKCENGNPYVATAANVRSWLNAVPVVSTPPSVAALAEAVDAALDDDFAAISVNMAALSDADLARVAKAVNDEAHRRSAG